MARVDPMTSCPTHGRMTRAEAIEYLRQRWTDQAARYPLAAAMPQALYVRRNLAAVLRFHR